MTPNVLLNRPCLVHKVFCRLNYQYLELTFYEVKYPKRFQWYVNQLPQWCSDNGGSFLGGTSKVNQMMGMTKPNYITVTQWRTEEEYAKYHQNGNANMFPNAANWSLFQVVGADKCVFRVLKSEYEKLEMCFQLEKIS
ncbi:unnamed protein product [Dibothriocephalus latus]|uniref:Uncharacterized protein n=1 Tax=Dibothriocephalus latus TaxID=60516 RepID=A0A3P7L553_DIBLA|nr:unnamed protein product [Dibothriocephalus latus]